MKINEAQRHHLFHFSIVLTKSNYYLMGELEDLNRQ